MIQPPQTSIQCKCRNGHRIKAALQHRGKVIRCPKCAVSVRLAVSESKDSGVFEEAVLEWLSEPQLQTGLHSPKSIEPRAEKITLVKESASRAEKPSKCPRCRKVVDVSSRTCRGCNLMLETHSRLFQSVYRDALIEVVGR